MESILVIMERCVACRSCEVACAVYRSSVSKKLPEAIYEEIQAIARIRVESVGDENGFPIQCRHCDNAPCLDACPADALYRDKEGLVLLHEARCIGCWMCIMVCPFGSPQPFRGYRKIIKCDRCKGMEAPYCVESCPTGALILADPEEIASGRRSLSGKSRITCLNFTTDRNLAKTT
jgi:carbon-monoxide dehydrogenase iron sulfur subunit